MEPDSTLEILKQALLLEKRGKVFYNAAADNSKDPDVSRIFRIMADEEDKHVFFLSEQFKVYRETGHFDDNVLSKSSDPHIADEVLPKSLSDRISATSYEATAISMAIDMENRAIAAYSQRAEKATDLSERKFYELLADWERGHHKVLYNLDQELKEKIWTDNHFWPF